MRAIIPVHLFGLCCEMDAIQRDRKAVRAEVIEDAAQAIGAEYPVQGRCAQAGTMGEAGWFSFYPSKNLGAAGDAGLIICDDEAELRSGSAFAGSTGWSRVIIHHFVGGNFRLDEIQAAVLKVKLPHLDRWSAARREVADFYREEFERRGLTEQISCRPSPTAAAA